MTFLSDDPAAALEIVPRAPGAYLLLIRLDARATLAGRFRNTALDPGLYAYAGSARGPGGLRARIGRHLRTNKRPHWHIDALTSAGRIVDIAFVENGTECALVDKILALRGAAIPVAGFGSSDCSHCPAHLVKLPGSPRPRLPQALRRLVGG